VSSGIKISAVVVAQDVAPIIARCVRSLTFADEVVVVDANSEDGTPDIARRHGARIVSRAWPGFAEQKQFAVAEARGTWVFLCDSDEEVPEVLAREIREVVESGSSAAGYRVKRRNQFLGEWMLHGPWTKDRVIRLFRKDKGRVADKSVHEGIVVEGEVRELVNELYHYTHPTLSESVSRLNRYTSLEARDRVGRRKIRLVDPFLPPLGVFFKYYFIKGCWKAGVRGFLLSAITAIYKSVLYIKILCLQRTALSNDRPDLR
jgi:glycosyltransferase involved in cell wall biosynthesis